MKMIRIAIDGPSGAGKSTIAKMISSAMGIDYIDTGAMYRAVGYKMMAYGVSIDDQQSLAALLDETKIDFLAGNIILDGSIVNDQIRTNEIANMASACSALACVRTKLVELQKEMAARKSVVMDGRDIGTNVIPDAEYKFFLTALPEERARRRFLELSEKGQAVTYEQVLNEIKQRDHNDMTRELNPLAKAEDAIEVDTTGFSAEEVRDIILKEVREYGDSQTI